MATSTRDPAGRPLVLALGLGFLALVATLSKALETMIVATFTLTPDAALAWGFWTAASLALLSAAGMMATGVVLHRERRADA